MDEISKIAREFVSLDISKVTHLVSGNIQATYLIEGLLNGENYQFILQKLNTKVFPYPQHLVENHQLLMHHLKATQSVQIIPDLIATKNGNEIHMDGKNAWRAQEFIPDSTTYKQVFDEAIALKESKSKKLLNDY